MTVADARSARGVGGAVATGPPTLATVIVSRNTRDLLRGCLRTLHAGTRTPNEVWVVDSDSSDGSAAMVEREFPTVRLLSLRDNPGFGAANNVALRRLRGVRYVLLINPDTEVPAGVVDALVAYLEREPAVAAAGVQLLNPDGSPQYSFDRFYSLLGTFRRNRLVEAWLGETRGVLDGGTGQAVPVDWIVGACLIVRLDALHETGLFDEVFFMYGEEQDLQWRLRAAGWAIHLLPHLHVVHFGGQSAKQARREMMIQEYRSRYLLVHRQRRGPARLAYVARATAALACLVAAWRWRAALGGGDDARQRAENYLAVLQAHGRPSFYAARRLAPAAQGAR